MTLFSKTIDPGAQDELLANLGEFSTDSAANLILEPGGTIVACNRAFLDVFGLDCIEDAEGGLFAHFETRDRRRIQRALAAGRPPWCLVATGIRHDGSRIRLVTCWRIQEVGGRDLVSAVLVCVPEAGTRRSSGTPTTGAHRRWQLSRDLVGAMAHELNNALAPLLLYCSLLRQQLAEPADHDLFSVIEGAIEQAAHQVQRILGFSHAGEGQAVTISAEVLAKELVRQVRRNPAAPAAVDLHLAPRLTAVRGDPVQLLESCSAACSHCLASVAGQAVLTVSVGTANRDAASGSDGAFVVLQITARSSDAGDDVEEDHAPNQERVQPRSLDLDVAISVLEEQGGALVRDADEGGFLIFIPAAGRPPTDTSTPPVRRRPRATTRPLILVVDDERPVRVVARRLLEQQRIDVLTAGDGAAALELVERHGSRIQTVLTDLSMPGMTGRQTIDAMRDRFPDLRIVVMTGSLDERLDLEADGVEVEAFLDKPFHASALLRALGIT